MDLNGYDETIGNVDAQTALTLRASSLVTTGAGTLTLNGNIAADAAAGRHSVDPALPPAVIDGKLHLGDIVRTIDIADRSELAVDLHIAADITGTGGIRKTGTGLLLLSGNNSYSGSTFLEDGSFAAGSDDSLWRQRGLRPAGQPSGRLAMPGPLRIPSTSAAPSTWWAATWSATAGTSSPSMAR